MRVKKDEGKDCIHQPPQGPDNSHFLRIFNRVHCSKRGSQADRYPDAVLGQVSRLKIKHLIV